jgi:hypothetical protein
MPTATWSVREDVEQYIPEQGKSCKHKPTGLVWNKTSDNSPDKEMHRNSRNAKDAWSFQRS